MDYETGHLTFAGALYFQDLFVKNIGTEIERTRHDSEDYTFVCVDLRPKEIYICERIEEEANVFSI